MGVIVIVGALVTGVLALTHIGPFRPSPGAAATLSTPADMPTNLRGVWSVQDSYGNVPFPATMHITTENRSSGTFVGSITSPVGVETITGKVIATAVSFTINLGSGTEHGSGTVSQTGGKVQIQATFSNSSGGHGTIAATRTSP